MIESRVLHHAAFWEQDCCTSCGCVVERAEEEQEAILAECPLCESPRGRWNAAALETLMKLIDQGDSDE